MREMTERLAEDADLAAALSAAHEDYLAPPGELGRRRRRSQGVSAGGMPTGSSACTCWSRTPWPPVRASTPSATRRSRCSATGGPAGPACPRTGGGHGVTRVGAIDCGTNSIRLLGRRRRPAAGALDRRAAADGGRATRLRRGPHRAHRPGGDGAHRSRWRRSMPRQCAERGRRARCGSWRRRPPVTPATREEFVAGVRDGVRALRRLRRR